MAVGPAGSGFPVTRNFLGSELSGSGAIPTSSIPDGLYEAKVRCACEITPVPVATPFSNSDMFVLGSFRLNAVAETPQMTILSNPATYQLGLTYDAVVDEEVTFRITSVSGQELFSEAVKMAAGKQNVTFDLSDFTSGFYILSIVNGNRVISEKFEVLK